MTHTPPDLIEALRHNQGISLSFVVAVIVVTLRAIKEKSGFIGALLDITISGLGAPTLVWLVWQDAPFFVYGFIAAVVARWPDLVDAAINGYLKRKNSNDSK
jgi:hypothetical protein